MATVDMNLQEASSWLSKLQDLNGQLQQLLGDSNNVVQDIAQSGRGGILDHFVESYNSMADSTVKMVNAFSGFAESLGNLFEKAGGFLGEVTGLIKEVGKFVF